MHEQDTPFTHAGYRVWSRYEPEKARRLLDGITTRTLAVSESIKDNPRNYIARATFEGDDAIVKIPRSRDRRLYEQFLTWFRPGEAVRRYASMVTLERLGFSGTPPILAAERRRAGRVVENIFVYGYAKGRLAGPGDEALLVQELVRLYQLGYLRRDCKPGNFVIDSDQVHFIDFRLTRPRWLRRFRIYMEFNHFLENMPTARPLVEAAGYQGVGFALAGWLKSVYTRWNKRRQRLSRLLRGRRRESTQ